jgi:tRNA A37 threonylcarbamoyladenosine biosynthesis protein TsaE
MNNQLFDLVENTSRNIFLTGKAGTGKTTFLNNFVKKTRKKHIVVAPTGIAAIDWRGVQQGAA